MTNFGRFLSEELIARLYQTRKFKVIDRQQLNKIITEQKLSLTGVVDPASAQRLGRVLGVDSIVFGSISDLVKSLKINARLIGTETGEVFAAASIEIVKDDAVVSLMGDGIIPSTSSPGTTTDKAPMTQKASANDYTAEVKACRRAGTNVTCELAITNDSPRDRKLELSAKNSQLIDQSGNEYRGVVCNLGAWVGERNYYAGDAFATLIPNVPVRGSIKFENVSTEATSATLSLFGWPQFKLTFRNIEITK